MATAYRKEGANCLFCEGIGVIFECLEWERTNGECCPAGTMKANCPGSSIQCEKCNGTGVIR